MSFIKHGDGKIVSVFEEDVLTEDQKKVVKKSNRDMKQWKDQPEASDVENSEK